jgi:23S rRNA (guanosine2251-2'-O)-methyltransferase
MERPAFSKDRPVRKPLPGKTPFRKPREDSAKDAEISRSDFLAGRNPVMEALRSGRPISKIFILAGERQGSVREIIGLAKDKGVLVQETEQGKLDLMSSGIRHQGVVALVSPVPYSSVEDILLFAQSKGERPCIILLDGLKDPQNLGNLIRSAEVAGAHGVLIPQRRNVQLSGAVAKASAGAVEYMKVAQVGNVAQTLEALKKQGLWIIGADAAAEQDYFETDLTGPVVIVIGGEGEGMARLTKDRCDKLVRIPVKGRIGSLNAATAGAVLLFDVARQRSAGKR